MEEVDFLKNKILNSFKGLTFVEEGHKYYLNNTEMLPVSNVTHEFKEHFDTNGIATRYGIKHNMATEAVIKMWEDNAKEACEFGTSVHNFAEDYFYDRTLKPRNKHEEAVVKFWNDMPDFIIPVLCETRVYSEEFKYAGTFDLLLYDSLNKGLLIFDYKTNKDLFKNFANKRLLEPFTDFLDQPFGLYNLQLSCYQIPLEDIGLKVIGRRLVWLKPNGEYEKIATKNLTNELRTCLKIDKHH